ncbi:MAG: caspase family protein [Magnetococcales bacterium]|nr:caspase family protein [Magnetococcales bacterium]
MSRRNGCLVGSLLLLLAGCSTTGSEKTTGGAGGGGAGFGSGGGLVQLQESPDCKVIDLDNASKWQTPQWQEALKQCPKSGWAGLNLAHRLQAEGNLAEARVLAERFSHTEQGRKLLASLPKPAVVTPIGPGGQGEASPEPVSTRWNFRRAVGDYSDMVFVAIGNRNYTHGIDLEGVRFAHNDQRAMLEFAEKSLGIVQSRRISALDYSSAELKGLLNPARGQLRRLAELGARRLFLYYSGHGAAVPEETTGRRVARLVGIDAREGILEEASVALEEVIDKVSKAGYEELILVVEACFSGNLATGTMSAFSNSMATTREAANDVRSLELPAATGRNRASSLRLVRITATSENELALPDATHGHGLFTYHLLRALNGEMGNRPIDTDSLRAWLTEQVNSAAFNTVHRMSQRPLVGGARTTLVNYR